MKLPLKKDLIWAGARAARPQIAGDKSADARFPASQILMITPLPCVLCAWSAGAWSAAQSFKNGSILTSPHEGTFRLENSDLWYCSRNWPSSDKPLQIASLIYSWSLLPLYPCQFSPFPSRSALRAVGQSSRTALLLLPAYLTSSSPARMPPPICPCAPITFQIHWWLQPPSCSTIGVRGERTCWQHKMASNQVNAGCRNTIKD